MRCVIVRYLIIWGCNLVSHVPVPPWELCVQTACTARGELILGSGALKWASQSIFNLPCLIFCASFAAAEGNGSPIAWV